MSKKVKVTDIIPDDNNFNKGTQFGKHLLDKSFQKFGAARSILIDKNGKVIAGNKSLEAFGELGGEEVQIIQSDGKNLIAVQRTDIDLDTPEGREMAMADNQTAIKGIEWDYEELSSELDEMVLEEWGFVDINIPEELTSNKNSNPPSMKITFINKEDLENMKIDIDSLIKEKFIGTFYSVAMGSF